MFKVIRPLSVLMVCASGLTAQTADMVFTNASVLTMNDDAPTAEAVAVVDNKITYVGDAAGVAALVGDNVEGMLQAARANGEGGEEAAEGEDEQVRRNCLGGDPED